MNYLAQVRAFERKLLKNPWALSRNAQILWYRINSWAGVEGGTWEVSFFGMELSRMMGVTLKTFLAARDELERKGFIKVEKGARARRGKLRITNLYEEKV
jgi:hypothetical protein